MATSDKRVAANRQNAKKSTGPRTLDGKERARLNAVTHGLTAQTAVLPGEDPAELEALGKSLMRQLKPRGVVQRIIAERVVSLAWKLRRVARAEEAVAREMDEAALASWQRERDVNLAHDRYIFAPRDRPRPRDGATLLAASWQSERHSAKDERLLRLSEYELKLDAALRAAVRELLRLQKDAHAFEDGEEEPEEAADSGEPPTAEVVEAKVEPPAEEGCEISNLKSETSDPEPPPSHPESPISDLKSPIPDPDKTNPTPSPASVAEVAGVTGLAAESSAPAPGTSACPPPGPRR
jgi:hypothetical protein